MATGARHLSRRQEAAFHALLRRCRLREREAVSRLRGTGCRSNLRNASAC